MPSLEGGGRGGGGGVEGKVETGKDFSY